MFFEVGDYMPDVPSFQNQGSTVAKNVVSTGVSYTQFLGPSVYSNALSARCQGAVSTKDINGNSVTFAGNATKLYKLSAGTYSDVSVGGGYSTGTEEMWFFTRFGDRLIATNFADNPQSFLVSSGSSFANLTTAVKARYCATVRNFLVLGNTSDAVDGAVPHRVRWSALNDCTDFTVSATTQSDYQDLNATNGWVRGVVSGEYGVIFQERAISRMTYVGSPTVWQFDEVESGRGALAAGSIARAGNLDFYLGPDGFYVFDGTQSVPIGANFVDRTLFNELDTNYLSRITSTVDMDKKIIYWAIPVTGNNGGLANKIYCFNFAQNATKHWSFIEPGDTEIIFTSLSENYTLEQMDTINASVDALPLSLDSRIYTGENFIFSGFNSSHKQINFTGSALDGLVETGETQINPGQRTEIFNIRPVVDGGTITVQMGTRGKLTDSVTYAAAVSTNSSGECPVRSNARFHRARLNITGGFNFAQGVDVIKSTPVGDR
jgi:hypothetical protein